VVSDLDELAAKLQKLRGAVESESEFADPSGAWHQPRSEGDNSKLAVLFPGQGSQYPDMLLDLAVHFRAVREEIERAERALDGSFELPLGCYLYPPPAFTPEEQQQRESALRDTRVAQPALGAVELAAFRLLGEFGVAADMVGGHSYGEYAALAAAGVFDAEQLARLSEARGRWIVDAAERDLGTMAAVSAPAELVEEITDGVEDVWIANFNAPRQTVISGSLAAVEEAIERLKDRGVQTRPIPVSCGFHSPLVAPARDRLIDELRELAMAGPNLPAYSNSTAAPYPADPAMVRKLLSQHLVTPVRFSQEIEAMYEAGARIFVEVGPKAVLTGLVGQVLDGRPHLALPLDRPGRPGLGQLQHLLGVLFVEGRRLNLDPLFAERDVRLLDLDHLGEAASPPPLPASTWMVSGGSVRPIKEEAVRFEPLTWSEGPGSSAPVAAQPRAFHGSSNNTPEDADIDLTRAASAAPPAEAARVVREFQRSMSQLIESQERVMLAYLGASQTDEIPTQAERPVEAQPETAFELDRRARVAATAEEPLPDAEGAPLPEAGAATEIDDSDSAAATMNRDMILDRLIAIVVDRTGYPAELLDADASLEADLGIDSIKRVEILGELQRSLPEGAEQHFEGLMDELTSAPSLADIAARIAEAVAGAAAGRAAAETVTESVLHADVAPSERELLRRLVEIVVDRTGYPEELVDADASLEADLGIDSIKRVEILGELQRALPEGTGQHLEGLMDELTSAPSLAAVAGRITAALAGPATDSAFASGEPEPVAGPRPPSTAAEGDTTEPLPRSRIDAVEIAGPSMSNGLEGTIVIVDDGRGLASALRDRLGRDGFEVQLLDPAGLDPENGHEELVKSLVEVDDLAGIVYLPVIRDAVDLKTMSFFDWRQRLRDETGRLFTLIQAAAPALAERARDAHRPRFIAATALGGRFAFGTLDADEGLMVSHGGICGLGKTLAVERCELAVKVVDLDLRESAESLAEHLAVELLADDDLIEVGWRDGSRWRPYPVIENVEAHGRSFLDEDSVVLLTGGARGITADIALALAERDRPSLVLVGRTPAPEAEGAATAELTDPAQLRRALLEVRRQQGRSTALPDIEADLRRLLTEREMRETFAKLDEVGVRWEYLAADVRDPEDVARLAAHIQERWGSLHAIVHGAGTIEDKLLADKTWDSFERVFETKALSAFLLMREVVQLFDDVRFVAFFSSVAGAFPNRGQSDYVAGNEVMNKVALALADGRSESRCRVVALNWGPWEKGMASEGVQRQFRDRGIEPIGVAAGCAAFLDEIDARDDAALLVLGRGPWTNPHHSDAFAGARRMEDGDGGVVKERSAAASRPLLNRSVGQGVGQGFTLERILDPAIDVYLDDHRLDGRPVLPMAAALEMMVELAELGWPALTVTEVRELSVIKGITLSEGNNHQKSVRFDARVVDDRHPDALVARIEVRDAENPNVLHYRSTVVQARSLERLDNHRPAQVEKAYPLTIADAYRKYLFHGHRFAHIEQIDGATRSGLLAQIRPSDPESFINGGSGDWLIDPVVIDSGLQLVLLWARNELDVTPLPARFARYRRFGPLSPSNGGPILCELKVRPQAGGSIVVSDLTFFEEDGKVLGILEGLECPASRELNRLGGSARLDHAAGGVGGA